jgi:succinate dehydrogenase / fumarate reductase cytochrome b subunit
MLGEIVLVFMVIYHGVNGARIAIFDLFIPDRWNIQTQRKSAKWTLAISILLWLPAAYLMGRSMLVHNFG